MQGFSTEVKSIKTVAVQNKNKKDQLIENLQEELSSSCFHEPISQRDFLAVHQMNLMNARKCGC